MKNVDARSGFGVLEVMVALGISIIGLMAILDLQRYTMQGVARTNQKLGQANQALLETQASLQRTIAESQVWGAFQEMTGMILSGACNQNSVAFLPGVDAVSGATPPESGLPTPASPFANETSVVGGLVTADHSTGGAQLIFVNSLQFPQASGALKTLYSAKDHNRFGVSELMTANLYFQSQASGEPVTGTGPEKTYAFTGYFMVKLYDLKAKKRLPDDFLPLTFATLYFKEVTPSGNSSTRYFRFDHCTPVQKTNLQLAVSY
ncbi:MAG: hypothetical protein AB7P04_11495 [Bacteriovoracia bacterium]